MELVKIAGPAHYLPGRVNIGVIIGNGQAALIDTGLDEGAARTEEVVRAAAVKAHLSAHVREGRVTFEIQDRRPLGRRLPYPLPSRLGSSRLGRLSKPDPGERRTTLWVRVGQTRQVVSLFLLPDDLAGEARLHGPLSQQRRIQEQP